MAQAALFESYQGSRLVRVLSEILALDVPLTHKQFALKLGELVDLSDSFALSDQLRSLPRLRFTPATDTDESPDPQQQFMRWQAETVQSMVAHFERSEGHRPLQLPGLSDEKFRQPQQALDAYLRFYALHQSEMDGKVLRLRHQVREAAKQHSPSMLQLATLDAALNDTLNQHQRRLLAVIPRLLGFRFHQLLQEHQAELAQQQRSDNLEQWHASDSWHARFLHEMQSVMLAELELRLQPIIGMLDAMGSEAPASASPADSNP